MTWDSTLCIPSLLYSYQQDIFQKNAFFLVLCECTCNGWSAQQNVTCGPAFRYDVLLFQPISLHSELFHSQFESVNSLLALLDAAVYVPSFWGEGTWSRAFCFPDVVYSTKPEPFLAPLLRQDMLHIRTTYIMMLLNKTWEKYIDLYLFVFF